MGEIADMMLDGTMCAGCGEWLHGGEDGPGYPGYCESCRPEAQSSGTIGDIAKAKPIGCPDCKRRFTTEQGLHDHRRMKHAVKP